MNGTLDVSNMNYSKRENINYLTGNNFTKENGAEQIDLNDGSEEEEDEKPKITKIVRVNKD